MKRSEILKLFPKRKPIETNPRILKGIKTTYGTREMIEYSVAPGERVRAYLLTPKGSHRRSPGILASHQHNGQYRLGKSEPAGLSKDTMYHYGVDLCRKGYVVICPDHLGFEERAPYKMDRRKGVMTKNHECEMLIFVEQLLHGSSLTAKYLFDMCQAMDVLQSLDRVDPHRLGVIGHSLGGQTALWHAFYDERVKVAFSSCGFGTLASTQKHGVPHNFAAYLPGLLKIGDLDDVIALITPRAFGMSNGTKDWLFPMDGVRQVHRKAQQSFTHKNLLSIIFDGPHCFPDSVKRRAYAFLGSHLQHAS